MRSTGFSLRSLLTPTCGSRPGGVGGFVRKACTFAHKSARTTPISPPFGWTSSGLGPGGLGSLQNTPGRGVPRGVPGGPPGGAPRGAPPPRGGPRGPPRGAPRGAPRGPPGGPPGAPKRAPRDPPKRPLCSTPSTTLIYGNGVPRPPQKRPQNGPPRGPPGGPPRGGQKSAHFFGYLITLPVGTVLGQFSGPPRDPPGTPPGDPPPRTPLQDPQILAMGRGFGGRNAPQWWNTYPVGSRCASLRGRCSLSFTPVGVMVPHVGMSYASLEGGSHVVTLRFTRTYAMRSPVVIHWHRLGTFDTTRSVPLVGDRCVREKRCDGSHCASSAQWGVRDALEEHLPQSKWRKPCAGWRGHGKEGRLREPNADPTGVDTCGRP